MNDFERRDEQFDDQVQIEHLDLSDTCQERKRYRVFQLLGCFGQTHRWGRRGILSGGLISFLILLSLLVFSNALPLSSPQKHLPLLPSPLVSPPTPLEVVAATGQVVYVANKADDSLNALEAQTGIMRLSVFFRRKSTSYQITEDEIALFLFSRAPGRNLLARLEQEAARNGQEM